MNEIQVKSLKHVSALLKSHDTYIMYHAISDLLTTISINGEQRKVIMNVIQSESNKVKVITDNAKEWIDALIRDSEKI